MRDAIEIMTEAIYNLPVEVRILLVAVAFTAVLLLFLGILKWIGSRRGRSRQGRQFVQSEKVLRETLSAYRETHPDFYRVLRIFQKKRLLDDLVESDDVALAFAKLRTHKRSKEARRKKSSSSLLITPATGIHRSGKEVSAAMITILRALNLDPEMRKELPEDVEGDLDRALDTLTR